MGIDLNFPYPTNYQLNTVGAGGIGMKIRGTLLHLDLLAKKACFSAFSQSNYFKKKMNLLHQFTLKLNRSTLLAGAD